MKDIEIIPGILTNNSEELRSLLARATGVAKRVHIDIIDGVFAGNKTIDPSVLNNIDNSLLIDFHLMVKSPISWLEKCLQAGGARAIGQVERMNDPEEYVKKCQGLGLSPGLALDLTTPVDYIEPRILMDVDVVLLMSVPAGYGGQKFEDSVLTKIKELIEIRGRDSQPFKIIDDGGIVLSNVDDVARAGVDEVVIGQRIFEGDLKDNIAKFKSAA